MEAEKTLAQIRKFLLFISAGIFVMTVAELIFLGHWDLTIQYLPFMLIVLGLVAAALAFFRPTRRVILFTRWSMIIIAACSLIGFYEHMSGNLTFWQDVQPDATIWELIVATFEGGIPVLAPGILTLGGVIGWTATYKHPALDKNV